MLILKFCQLIYSLLNVGIYSALKVKKPSTRKTAPWMMARDPFVSPMLDTELRKVQPWKCWIDSDPLAMYRIAPATQKYMSTVLLTGLPVMRPRKVPTTTTRNPRNVVLTTNILMCSDSSKVL